MKNEYRKMMGQISLSESARSDILEKLEWKQPAKRTLRPLRAAVIALCACLALVGTAFAVEALTGVGLVEFIRTESRNGYHVEFDSLKPYPIAAFSEEVRCMKGNVEYQSWEEAEKCLGIDLGTSAALSDSTARPIARLDGRNVGMDARVHCFVRYASKDDQLYHARVMAYYAVNRKWEGESRGPTDIDVIVSATVAAEHPGISADFQYHSGGKLYNARDVDNLTEERYTTPSGLTATVLTVNRKDRSPIYEAFFAANDISYSVTIKGSPYEATTIPKGLLYEILDGFEA